MVGEDERRLDPPLSLLRWLAGNISCVSVNRSGDKGEIRSKRQALACGDPEVLCEALEQLDAGKTKSGKGKWWVLEGPSSPDVFLESNSIVFVLEGKRKEGSITTKTTWMAERNQLIRHMDAAWEVSRGRKVFGMLLVEGDENDPFSVPEKWLLADIKLLESSLPHRSTEVQQKLKNGILGVATWQRVCREFEISWSSLPDEV